MASLKEFSGVSFVKGAGDQESDVVDHVAVGEVLHELCQ